MQISWACFYNIITKLGCKIPSNSPEITDYPVILPFFGTEAVPVYVKLLCFLKKDFWVIGQ